MLPDISKEKPAMLISININEDINIPFEHEILDNIGIAYNYLQNILIFASALNHL